MLRSVYKLLICQCNKDLMKIQRIDLGFAKEKPENT